LKKLQEGMLRDVLKRAGLMGPDQELPAAVRVKHGVNRRGRTLRYYLNYSSDVQTFQYPYGAGTDLLSGTAVAPSQTITLKPWDLAIIEEK
jgi:beta-galactosidase